MKSLKRATIALAGIIGIGGAFAFTSPRTEGGWRDVGGTPTFFPADTYECNTLQDVTCTYTDDNLNIRKETGTFAQ